MGEATTVQDPASTPGQQPALSVGQMLQLMRIELDNAQLHGYPISCLLMALDAAEDWELERVRKSTTEVFRALKEVTFKTKTRGLALRRDGFLLAMLPHADPARASELARQVNEILGQLELDEDEEPLTVSVGVGHNMHSVSAVTFSGLFEEAETGMTVAQSAGGGRCVVWNEVESELESLREELESQFQALESSRDVADSNPEEQWARVLIKRVAKAFDDEEEQSVAVLCVAKHVLHVVQECLDARKELPTVKELSARCKEIDTLGRRIRKLTEQLEGTESELKRVAAMKIVDGGIASVYRTVQGLADEEGAEQKKEMLKDIFAANLALQNGG